MKDMKRFITLFSGLFICAVGITLLYKANLGMNPWSTFDLGINHTFGISIGVSSQLVGLTIIAISLLLGIKPGLGTLFNMFFIGFFVDRLNQLFSNFTFDHLPTQLTAFALGLMIFNFGIYFYLSARLGGGPRDGLMLGLIKKFHLKVAPVRITIESTALLAGFLLGGKVGLGTVILTLFNGPILQWIFKRFRFDPKAMEQESIDKFFTRVFAAKKPIATDKD